MNGITGCARPFSAVATCTCPSWNASWARSRSENRTPRLMRTASTPATALAAMPSTSSTRMDWSGKKRAKRCGQQRHDLFGRVDQLVLRAGDRRASRHAVDDAPEMLGQVQVGRPPIRGEAGRAGRRARPSGGKSRASPPRPACGLPSRTRRRCRAGTPRSRCRPSTVLLSSRKRTPASTTSGEIWYSGRGNSRPSVARNARSTSSDQDSRRSTRMGRCASRICADTSPRSRVVRSEMRRRRQVPIPTRMPGGTE